MYNQGHTDAHLFLDVYLVLASPSQQVIHIQIYLNIFVLRSHESVLQNPSFAQTHNKCP